MGETAWFLVLTPVLLCLMLIGIRVVMWRGEQMLRDWATRNDFMILERESKYLSQSGGPFVPFGRQARPVYLVTLKDKSGAVLRAWVACGGWFWGVLSRDVKVVWLDGNEEKSLPPDSSGA